MKYEDWVGTLSVDEQSVFNRLIEHNMSLVKGHNGAIVVSKNFLSADNWNSPNYHYQSIEFENRLIELGEKEADYPLINNSADNRWITWPYKRII